MITCITEIKITQVKKRTQARFFYDLQVGDHITIEFELDELHQDTSKRLHLILLCDTLDCSVSHKFLNRFCTIEDYFKNIQCFEYVEIK